MLTVDAAVQAHTAATQAGRGQTSGAGAGAGANGAQPGDNADQAQVVSDDDDDVVIIEAGMQPNEPQSAATAPSGSATATPGSRGAPFLHLWCRNSLLLLPCTALTSQTPT